MTSTLSVPRWVCAMVITIGIAAFCVQCAVDIYQGTRGIVDDVEWWTQAWQSALPTGFTIAFSAVGGYFLGARLWGRAASLYIIVAVVMAITASNGIDFLSNNTVAKTQAAQKREVVAKDIAAIQTDTAKQERKETIDNLWRTYTVTKKAEDKQKVLEQIKGVTDTPLAVQAPRVEEIKAGGGTILARYGFRPEIIQEVRALAVPIIFLFAKSIAITLGFALWPAKSKPPERPPKDGGDSFTGKAEIPVNPPVSTALKLSRGPKLSIVEARRDLVRMLGEVPTISKATILEERWNWTLPTVLRTLEAWETEGVCKTRREGRNRVIMRPGPRLSQESA